MSGGTSKSGPAGRLLIGSGRRITDDLSDGLATRLVAAHGVYPITDSLSTGVEDYIEFGLGLRPEWHPHDRLRVAASAGYGLVLLTDRTAYSLPVSDLGFTIPRELEGAVRVGGSVGITAAVSRSVAMSSMRTATETRSLRWPEGCALGHWTATLGVRIGRWECSSDRSADHARGLDGRPQRPDEGLDVGLVVVDVR